MALFEDEQGRGIFEYDKPSSYFGQYGHARVTEVGHYLDANPGSCLAQRYRVTVASCKRLPDAAAAITLRCLS